jgi:alkaline phosphatase D
VGSSSWRQPLFFKMNPNFDMTGVVQFEGLEPEQAYDYQMGFFFSELDVSDFYPDFPLTWNDVATISFRTGVDDPTRSRSFILGSCRYLLMLLGRSWLDTRGDKTFRSIVDQITQGVQTDLVLMVGDQIYADDLDVFRPDELLDEFYARYRAAFSQPYLGQLLSQVPTYMMLDDHEIEDDWPAKATGRDWVVKYPAAIHAYLTYQASHGPLMIMEGPNRMVGVPDRLWYTFRDGCCDFFVCDTRTERYLSEDPALRRIMSDHQLSALKAWLVDGSGRVKLIVSSVPFFPDPVEIEDRADKWGGFLQQRTELLEFIRLERVRPVVFLSGDLHRSLKLELTSPDDPTFRVVSIVSSAFFWPYAHGGWRQFQLAGALPTLADVRYEVGNGSPVFRTDNFTRLTVEPAQIKMEVYARKGDLLYHGEIELKGGK